MIETDETKNMIKELVLLVNLSLDDLYKNDKYLLDAKANERSIIFHFGRYFINRLENSNYSNKYNVDCEYNRDKFNEKKYKEIIYNDEKHRIFPDIIMHQRGNNDNNILAIEFKTYFNNRSDGRHIDILKLKALTKQELDYKYKIGLFIMLGQTREKVRITKISDGRKMKNTYCKNNRNSTTEFHIKN